MTPPPPRPACGDTLIVYVPGYGEHGALLPLRSYVKFALAQPDAASGPSIPLPRPRETSIGGYSGLRYTFGDAQERHVDIVEVPWDTGIPTLTSGSPAEGISRGFVLLCLNFWSGLYVLGTSRAFVIASVVGLALMLFWYVLALMTAVGAVHALAGTMQVHLDQQLWPLLRPFWHTVQPAWHWLEPHGLLYVVLLTAGIVLALARIQPADLVNIADRYDRFAHDRLGADRVGMRTLVADRVAEAVAATASDAYGRVVVLGHSFGALVACAAMPLVEQPVELVTLGTFFAFLDKLDPCGMGDLFRGVVKSRVTTWYDFFSKNDWLSSNAGYDETTKESVPTREDPTWYQPTEVGDRWRVSLAAKFRTETHRYYFHDPEVIRRLFQPSKSHATTRGR